MADYRRRTIGLSSALAALAGYVDAIGFISLSGFFVSFMTGNTTRLGIDVARLNAGGIATAGGLLATFVGGVVIGALLAKAAGRGRRVAVLAWVATCLAAAAIGEDIGNRPASTVSLVLAMAAANCVFQRNGEVTIGVTYMTGTLVKMGQQIANAVTGGPKLAWLRNFTLWLGLAAGSVAGALAYDAIGSTAIWLASGFAGVLALLSLSLPHEID